MLPKIFFIQNNGLNQHNPISLGTQTRLINFYKAGFGEQFDYNLILAKSENVPEEIRKLSNSFYELPGSMYGVWSNIKFSIKSFIILIREHKTAPINIIHCTYPNSSLLPAVMFKLFVSKKTRILYNVRSPWIEMIFIRKHIHTPIDWFIKRLLHLEEYVLLRFVDLLLTSTAGHFQYYQEKYNANSIPQKWIPSPIDLNLFKPQKFDLKKKLNISKEKIIIGYIGTLDPSRKLNQFIRYFSIVVNCLPNLILVFLGWGPDIPRLKNLIEELGLTDKVFFLPPVPYNDVPKYISGFSYGLCHLPDEFVYRHSSPKKIQEYLACHVPVLASNIKAHTDMANELKGIYIYNNADDLLEILSQPVKPVVQNLDSRSIEETVRFFKNIYIDWSNEE